jgi:hypothetical protein
MPPSGISGMASEFSHGGNKKLAAAGQKKRKK